MLLHDGTSKNIEEIKVRDKILSVNLDGMLLEEDVVVEDPPYVKKYRKISAKFSNGIVNHFSPAHAYYVVGKGWAVFDLEEAKTELNFNVEELNIGDIVLFYNNGNLIEVKVDSLVDTGEFIEMYNVEHVEKNNSFFANNILVHNKFLNPKK